MEQHSVERRIEEGIFNGCVAAAELSCSQPVLNFGDGVVGVAIMFSVRGGEGRDGFGVKALNPLVDRGARNAGQPGDIGECQCCGHLRPPFIGE